MYDTVETAKKKKKERNSEKKVPTKKKKNRERNSEAKKRRERESAGAAWAENARWRRARQLAFPHYSSPLQIGVQGLKFELEIARVCEYEKCSTEVKRKRK